MTTPTSLKISFTVLALTGLLRNTTGYLYSDWKRWTPVAAWSLPSIQGCVHYYLCIS